jgi:hypothetical protein
MPCRTKFEQLETEYREYAILKALFKFFKGMRGYETVGRREVHSTISCEAASHINS